VAANVGRAFRVPTLFELYTNGPLLSDARYVIGDPSLRAERSWNADASVRWQLRAVRGEVAAFRNRIDDFIHLSPSPSAETRAGLPVFEFRAVEATLVGGEAALTVEPSRRLSLFGRMDYVRGTDEGTGAPLPLMPPLRGDLGAELHTAQLPWADRVYIGAESEIVAKQTRLSPLESATGAAGRTLFHLSAGIARRLLGSDARLDVRVRNLTDVRYRDFLSRYKEFALSPGRNIVVRFSLGR
jgi:outer membrane receptor protein involved in Fe transport